MSICKAETNYTLFFIENSTALADFSTALADLAYLHV